MTSFEDALKKATVDKLLDKKDDLSEAVEDTQTPDEPTTADEVVVDAESGEAQPTETLEEPVTEPEAKPVVVEEIEVISADEFTPEAAEEEPKEAIINTEETLVEPVAKTEPVAEPTYSLEAYAIDALTEPTHILEAHAIKPLVDTTTLSATRAVETQSEEVVQESVAKEPNVEEPEAPIVAEVPVEEVVEEPKVEEAIVETPTEFEPKTVDEVLAELDIPEAKLQAIKAIVDAPEKVVEETPKPKAVTKPISPVQSTIETEDGKSIAVEPITEEVAPVEQEPKPLSEEELKNTLDTFIAEADKNFKDVANELGLDGKDGYRHALSKIKSGTYTPSDIILVDRLAAEAQAHKNAKQK